MKNVLLFPQSANAHPIVDDAAKNMHDAVKDLTDTLEEAASETGAVTGLVESISKAMNEVHESGFAGESLDKFYFCGRSIH